jgi:ABC-type Zn uptake system ZnuABC Zn-binding protein ZnuA
MIKIALLSFLVLAGCSTPSKETSSAVFNFKLTWCATNEPIRPTAEEIAAKSDEQKRKDLAHNLKGAEWCGWKA